MTTTKLQRKIPLKEKVDRFIFDWHSFPIDFWWRKKYGVPFGSRQHREMNFIDMAIEFREELLMNRNFGSVDEDYDDEILGLKDFEKNTVDISDEEVDEDYDDLDLEQFDKKD